MGQSSPTARTRAESYYNKSVVAYKEGDTESAMSYLGRGVHYVSDLNPPHRKYMVKELEAAPGYLKTEETWSFDATYQNPELEVISLTKEIENQPTVVEITKTDITDEKEVEGAKLQILNKDGEIVEEWVSTKEPHKVYALEPGEYILQDRKSVV